MRTRVHTSSIANLKLILVHEIKISKSIKTVKINGKRSSPVKIAKSPIKITQKLGKTNFPNAKIFPRLKQVDLKSMLNVNVPMDKEDDIPVNHLNKVRNMVKNYEANFVYRSPLVQNPPEVKIEHKLENEGLVKNAFEALMKSRGGDTPLRKTPRKRGLNQNSGNKKLKRLNPDKTTPQKNIEKWKKWSEK